MAPEQAARSGPDQFDPKPRRRIRRYRPKHALTVPPKFSPARTNLWLWLVVILTSGFVVGTTAAFNATVTESNSTFGTVALAEPSSQTITMQGANFQAAVGALGGVVGGSGTVGVRWRYYWPTGISNQGTSPVCATTPSSYPSSQDLGSSTTQNKVITYPSSVSSVSTDGRWMCVMSFTTYPNTDPVAPSQQWLSQVNNPSGATQLGMVLQSVALANVGTLGTLSQGDTITLKFNQPVDTTSRLSGNIVACMRSTNARILVGVSGTTCPSSLDTGNPSVSVMYLLAQGFTLSNALYNLSTTWSDSSTLVLAVISGSGSVNLSTKCTVAVSATGCFQASTQFTSNPGTVWESATGAKALCTANPAGAPDAGECFPNTTGRP